MKSFLKGLGNQKTAGLVGKVLKVGPYTIRVESSIGEGGFASIYKVWPNASCAKLCASNA